MVYLLRRTWQHEPRSLRSIDLIKEALLPVMRRKGGEEFFLTGGVIISRGGISFLGVECTGRGGLRTVAIA